MRKDCSTSRFSTLKRLYRFVRRLSSTWRKFFGQMQFFYSSSFVLCFCTDFSFSFPRIISTFFITVFVTDEQPLMHSDNTQSNEDELTDYTQTDYSEIFLYFTVHYPGMGFIIDYIKSAKPLQHGEMYQLKWQTRKSDGRGEYGQVEPAMTGQRLLALSGMIS